MNAVDFDIWAEDQGRGIENVERAMTDRFSTGGTLGLGLPGVKRMSDDFWIRSEAGRGTLVFARKTFRSGPVARSKPVATPTQGQMIRVEEGHKERYSFGLAWRPYPGNPFTGDAAIVFENSAGCLMAIVDASGHGRGASQVAQQVTDVLRRYAGYSLGQLLQKVHEELQGTVGAALGLAYLDAELKRMQYAATGNTRIIKVSGKKNWIGVASDGVLGNRLPTPQVQEVELLSGDLIAMWSDGIEDFEGRKLISQYDFRAPRDIAKMLVKKLARPYDDACCLALRWN